MMATLEAPSQGVGYTLGPDGPEHDNSIAQIPAESGAVATGGLARVGAADSYKANKWPDEDFGTEDEYPLYRGRETDLVDPFPVITETDDTQMNEEPEGSEKSSARDGYSRVGGVYMSPGDVEDVGGFSHVTQTPPQYTP